MDGDEKEPLLVVIITPSSQFSVRNSFTRHEGAGTCRIPLTGHEDAGKLTPASGSSQVEDVFDGLPPLASSKLRCDDDGRRDSPRKIVKRDFLLRDDHVLIGWERTSLCFGFCGIVSPCIPSAHRTPAPTRSPNPMMIPHNRISSFKTLKQGGQDSFFYLIPPLKITPLLHTKHHESLRVIERNSSLSSQKLQSGLWPPSLPCPDFALHPRAKSAVDFAPNRASYPILDTH
ncbi:unnamed protein product [Linum trigynum]|uniref:Uncharacterized protein n=1 Tax=Linum trigynum TaxID=586398 RepID=A0AAV2E4W7_9ROSI